ncbi:hypothetical protein LC087_18565 [Bacillus carboniphilus]|uniref:PH domain-containing protein n=1 Tax=Bacillus carboniphilus TaxID=86663 RepID=A0ABY9JTE2_9BACI|nr:hypothetical protein [Bacillus carboniphilus]WLR42654.1 hypothetical protein LC087_18565 [Bacillus carboniphilus]
MSKQKKGMMFYTGFLLFLISFIIWEDTLESILPVYFIFLPTLFMSRQLLNLFAIKKTGVLYGNRFIPWRKFSSFEFRMIDKNHKFYGYSKEVNEGYELLLHKRGMSVRCFVTSEEMKEKLTKVLNQQIEVEEYSHG